MGRNKQTHLVTRAALLSNGRRENIHLTIRVSRPSFDICLSYVPLSTADCTNATLDKLACTLVLVG